MKKLLILTILITMLGCGTEPGPWTITLPRGANGTNGIDGTNGATGAQGDKGDKGDTGNTGATGQSAVLNSGPVGITVSSGLSTCHHDYAYLSNGWLLFRHQANGTSDQGVGNTGFNVWNVDIAYFNLVAEIGNHAYCTLYFNKASHTLSYTVVTNEDGHNGNTGTINLE